MKFHGSALGSSYSPDPSFPRLSRPAHTGRVWEPNYQTAARCSLNFNPFLLFLPFASPSLPPFPSLSLPLLSHSRHTGVGDYRTLDPSTAARWSLNFMNHKSTVHISTTRKNAATNNTILIDCKPNCGQLLQSSRLAVYIQ